jgi:agmatinase
MRRTSERCAVVIAGARSVSSHEVRFLAGARERVLLHFRHETRPLDAHADGIIDALSEHVYVTIDVDVLDPGVMPATGTPEPGGLDWFELNGFLDRLAARRTIVAADLVEFAPRAGEHAWSCVAARLLYRLVGFLGRDDETA